MVKTLRFIFLDAGQGDCTLIQYPDGSLVVVDCGSTMNGSKISPEISKVFKRHTSSSKKLKALVLTHADMDHYNLVNDLVCEHFDSIGTIYIGGRPLENGLQNAQTAKQLNRIITPQNKCKKGYSRYLDVIATLLKKYQGSNFKSWDQVHSGRLESALSSGRPAMLDADRVSGSIVCANTSEVKSDEKNNDSIVLMFSYCNHKVLLMGDATKRTEHYIVKKSQFKNSVKRRAQEKLFLKVGHHGSTTSTTQVFLDHIGEVDAAFVSSDNQVWGKKATDESIGGGSTANKVVMDRLLKPKVGLKNWYEHYYVCYDKKDGKHKEQRTLRQLFSTLHRINFFNQQKPDEFEAAGTSWYLDLHSDGTYNIQPACSMTELNKSLAHGT